MGSDPGNIMKNEKMLKKIVKGVLAYWIIFVVITWVTFWIKDAIPDTLVQIGLGGGAFELLCSTLIEIAHKKYEKVEEKDEGIDYFDLDEEFEDEQRGTD